MNNSLAVEDSDEESDEPVPIDEDQEESRENISAPVPMTSRENVSEAMVVNAEPKFQGVPKPHLKAASYAATVRPRANAGMNRTNAGVNRANTGMNRTNAGINRNEPPRRNGSSLRAFPKLAAKTTHTRSLLTAHRKPRTDSESYIMPRQQYKKQQNQSSMKKISIGNTDKRHCVEDALEFLDEKNIVVNGLFQWSHYTAVKKSFVCMMNDYNFRLLRSDKDCEDFEIREYVDSVVMAQ